MKSLQRKSWLGITLLALTLLLQACGGGQTQPASGSANSASSGDQQTGSKVTTNVLNFGYVGSFPNISGAEGWGLHTGIIQEEFKKHGITQLNFIGFKVGPDLNEAIISGRVDIGHSGDTPAILNRAKGAKTRLIAQADILIDNNIIVRNDGPKTLQELSGKTVAVVKGSIMHRYLVGVLNKFYVKDVKLISIGANTADSLAALAKGEVDAVAANDSLVYRLIAGGGYTIIDRAANNPEFYTTHATVVTEDYLKKFPDVAKVWNAAREKALADLKTKPDEYYKYVSDLFGQPIDAVKELYPIEKISGVNFTEEGVQRAEGTKNFLVEEKLAAQDFDLRQWILK